jgi:hypothetical protein|tara:strand:+ start:1637 stop:1837 length:201 start_codon:yes stop_codon:yes gene_type:complete
MATVIKPKRSESAGSVPSANDLAAGEIAINSADLKIYTKQADGTVVEVANRGAEEGFAIALAVALG